MLIKCAIKFLAERFIIKKILFKKDDFYICIHIEFSILLNNNLFLKHSFIIYYFVKSRFENQRFSVLN